MESEPKVNNQERDNSPVYAAPVKRTISMLQNIEGVIKHETTSTVVPRIARLIRSGLTFAMLKHR